MAQPPGTIRFVSQCLPGGLGAGRGPRSDSCATRDLLEDLVEPPLYAAGLLLDVLVVDRHDLEALEIGRALRRRDIDARGIAAIVRKDLLRGVAEIGRASC